jgi:hypothetical protein
VKSRVRDLADRNSETSSVISAEGSDRIVHRSLDRNRRKRRIRHLREKNIYELCLGSLQNLSN